MGLSLVDKTVDLLTNRIVDGTYPIDEALPSQDLLSEQLQVSRPTLREATKVLAQRGLVRVEHGNGTFVNPTHRWTHLAAVAHAASGDAVTAARSLIELRRILESGAASLCAQRADASVLSELDAELGAMRSAAESGDVAAFVRHDIAFHEAIMRGTGNPFVSATLVPLRREIEGARVQTSSVPAIREHALFHHAAILDAIRGGDPEVARAAMDAHMEQTFDDLVEHIADA